MFTHGKENPKDAIVCDEVEEDPLINDALMKLMMKENTSYLKKEGILSQFTCIRCTLQGKLYNFVIDNENFDNTVMVNQLILLTKKHPILHKVWWIFKGMELCNKKLSVFSSVSAISTLMMLSMMFLNGYMLLKPKLSVKV